MAIDKEVFKDRIAILLEMKTIGENFTLSDRAVLRYWELLDPIMSTEEFEKACNELEFSAKHFPRCADDFCRAAGQEVTTRVAVARMRAYRESTAKFESRFLA